MIRATISAQVKYLGGENDKVARTKGGDEKTNALYLKVKPLVERTAMRNGVIRLFDLQGQSFATQSAWAEKGHQP